MVMMIWTVNNFVSLSLSARLPACSCQVLSAIAVPSYSYLGMFAGPTKPKPFERKRANLTQLKQSKMPALTKVGDRQLIEVG